MCGWREEGGNGREEREGGRGCGFGMAGFGCWLVVVFFEVFFWLGFVLGVRFFLGRRGGEREGGVGRGFFLGGIFLCVGLFFGVVFFLGGRRSGFGVGGRRGVGGVFCLFLGEVMIFSGEGGFSFFGKGEGLVAFFLGGWRGCVFFGREGGGRRRGVDEGVCGRSGTALAKKPGDALHHARPVLEGFHQIH